MRAHIDHSFIVAFILCAKHTVQSLGIERQAKINEVSTDTGLVEKKDLNQRITKQRSMLWVGKTGGMDMVREFRRGVLEEVTARFSYVLNSVMVQYLQWLLKKEEMTKEINNNGDYLWNSLI